MKTVNTFSNEAEYLSARKKYDTYTTAMLQYCKENKTNVIETDVTFPYYNEVNNELRSKIEVWEFIHEQPEKYFVYIDETERIATTFTGDFLGTVNFGYEYRSNMRDKRQSITVNGINGKKYHGTYFKDAGTYARIKQFKNQ